jgi:tetratricopeptide (TPR) repeat protein
MNGLSEAPLNRWHILGAIAALLAVVFAGSAVAAQVGRTRVELRCRLVPVSGERAYRSWTVDLQSSDGELLRRSLGATGGTVRFRNLAPAIYVVCVTGEKERRRCESVDLFLPRSEVTRQFSKDFKLPKPILHSPDSHKISSARLAVPARAQREVVRSQECRMRGEDRQALFHLEQALAIHPRYPEALNNMGTHYHRAGNYRRAIELFRKVTEVDPDFYLGWLNLGGSLLASGQSEPALEAQQRALVLRPDDITANALTAMSCFRLRRYPEARERFLKVAELDPVSAAFPHLYLALIAMAQNEKAEAGQYLRSFLDIHPNSPRSPYLRKTLDNLSSSSAMFSGAANFLGQPE